MVLKSTAPEIKLWNEANNMTVATIKEKSAWTEVKDPPERFKFLPTQLGFKVKRNKNEQGPNIKALEVAGKIWQTSFGEV